MGNFFAVTPDEDLFHNLSIYVRRKKKSKRRQVHLPKLPVPDLEQTMGKYLDNLKPILNEKHFEKVRLMVQEYADPDGPGHKVQHELLKRRENTDNWVYDWWLKDMYMGVRLCLPINVNPGMVFPPRQFRGFTDIARYGARIISQLSQYKDKLDRREIPIEKATSREKGQPLCMAQHYRLMTSYRLPGIDCDTLINTEPDGPRLDQHVILACQNKFYAVYLRKGGTTLTEDEIAGHILQVLESSTDTKVSAIGLLTSQPRNIWAENREALAQYEENRKSFQLIEQSLGILCLDQKSLGDKFQRRGCGRGGKGMVSGLRDETSMAHQMLHGGGSQSNTPNRWFDKTIQIVIGVDGVNGLCYEHSPSEAVALIGVIENILENCSNLSEEPLTPMSTALQELHWTEPPFLTKIINEAARSIDNMIEDLDFYVYRFDGYGKNFIKSCKMSPDAYIQMALQLAYYKLYGKLTSTYESASIRRFWKGRVDNIRSATWEAYQWVSAMTQPEETGDPLIPTKRDAEKLMLFDTAAKKQTDIMIENILGQGIDNHMLGLREQSQLMNVPMTLFNDESYKKFNHFALSTSQVATKVGFMGYGPVVPDGYGASYNILDDSVIFCLSAFYFSELTSTPRFAQSLEESLNSMQTLLQTRT
ncbi:choline O-acetyltransferase isoform X2 [Cimex lectularius]|uniref:Choline O-acetyltransferase n=1 Tax=Cimex lectularius TaxID=79782 RepID=A0A8I6RGZ7_CIMLE|nr:choline O-acetyltransferase isoform X2 [Cimex lectularius]